MSDLALLWSTFADRAEAERIAETVVTERLAACANILAPCTSVYRWDGKVERGEEVPALFKTTPELAAALRSRIGELHSYDLPVIEAWRASASDTVSDWVARETGG